MKECVNERTPSPASPPFIAGGGGCEVVLMVAAWLVG